MRGSNHYEAVVDVKACPERARVHPLDVRIVKAFRRQIP